MLLRRRCFTMTNRHFEVWYDLHIFVVQMNFCGSKNYLRGMDMQM